LATPLLHAAGDDAQRAADERIVSIILKMENFDLSKSTKAQGAVDRYLKANLGSPTFLELYKKFQIKDHDAQLLAAALAQPAKPGGIAAAKLLIAHGGTSKLTEATGAKETKTAAAAFNVLGRVGDEKLQTLVGNAVLDKERPIEVRRAAVEGLGANLTGQRLILKLAEDKTWVKDLDGAAASALILSTDEKIRAASGKRFKLGSGKFAPIPELLKKTGDIAKGKVAATTKGCIACHRIGDIGIDFGPALSEIGGKLPKAALYPAILDPSAGVSMGFEGYIIQTTDGGVLIGMITSTTEKGITVRMMGGITQTIPKDKFKSKTAMKQSLMPAGLAAAMSEQELVDLVEYLASLKGKSNDGSEKHEK
jgi:putative heme-binding domain-containing protein